jgi:hypothetical protein
MQKHAAAAELTMIVSFGVGTQSHPFNTLKLSDPMTVTVPAPSVPVEIPTAAVPAAIVAAPEIRDAGSLDLILAGVVAVMVL